MDLRSFRIRPEPYHIRVVSNSWGTDGDYDPNGVIAQLTDRLTYENGVAVIFAASNSGGSGAECSGDLHTNVYANTPSAISVAALTHDGTAVTSFSSRGCMNQQHTWPDVGAPGRDIWATAPLEEPPLTPQLERKETCITCPSRVPPWPPLTSVVWPASFSMLHRRLVQRIITETTTTLVMNGLVSGDRTAAYGQFEDWNERNNSRVHEVELILELTARYEGMANSCEAGNDEDSCNDIPEECYPPITTGGVS